MAQPHRLSRRLRAVVPATVLAAALLAPAAASAHAGHHSGAAQATRQVATRDAMFVVADPRNPRIARGPRGPLWLAYTPRTPGTTAMGLTYAERYVASQRAAAAHGSAQRTAAKGLTVAQATKKLSKKCRKLVKITKASQLKKLKKADRKARTKCLEQRRKIIADSKKDPAPTPTTPSTPAPSAPAPSTPAPSTPAPTSPAPTTPAPPAACTTPGTSPVTVTAIDEGRQFELSSCGVAAGSIQFTFDNTDADEEHNVVLAEGVTAGGGPSGTVRVISTNIKGGQSATKSFALAAGDYVLICTVDGHSAMTVKFKVFAS